MNKEQIIIANMIISSAAKSSLAWSGIACALPGLGTGADIPGLTVINMKMVRTLAELFNVDIDNNNINKFMSNVLQLNMLLSPYKIFLGLIPLLGKSVNATLSYNATEDIGWAVASLFDEGIDLSSLTLAEIKDYIKKSKIKVSEVRTDFNDDLERLDTKTKESITKMQHELADLEIPPKKSLEIIQNILNIIHTYKNNKQDNHSTSGTTG